MAEGLRNVKEAAAYLGISPKTLYAMTAARSVPFTRPGGGKHIRFSQAHLDAIVAAGEQQVIQPPALRVAGTAARLVGTHPPSGPHTPPPPSGPKVPRPQPGSASTDTVPPTCPTPPYPRPSARRPVTSPTVPPPLPPMSPERPKGRLAAS
ncbi:helix-turn-helix domain-containing protein [Actinoplanes rectilineatus]|uniref:helix-turn-helix domain-containing protein n=1 Tax=Actinoplanes rectilineatus TaxID=113571 RepID=UPI0005F298AA|nr:helix-turn-helix domain-containing protein [Actinoplanes rectilineatus]